MTEQERLQCNGIDINGLNKLDRERIEEVGFDCFAVIDAEWRSEIWLRTLAKSPACKLLLR
jgi:hypothetical protein